MSDIHDHIWNLEKVLHLVKVGKGEAIIFCGDMIAPFVSAQLAKTTLPTYLCLGNNDEDHIGMYKLGSRQFTWFHLSQEFGQVELDGKRIAFCHYPKLGELLAKSGEYDAVFHGHTHEVKQERWGETLLVNPGAVCGIQNGMPGTASFAWYDTDTHKVDLVTLD